ncbi:DUF4153 domain-containing protein [Zunongwangia pacifica]|uniref:DUF4153 domain-containing protein n=1 Tax=Zunongwangia pacifica TaxID=2911062 RepID=A0A9X1ZPY9_9FLAO|nr:DUF4153 domain-containing protein [Zunongwangia pacifica]MCL6217165.1 DUF4153 domain-containing protein [Zunongwangia pacifica]
MSYFKELPGKMNIAFRRFPLTLVWVILGSIYIIGLVETDANIFTTFYAETLVLILGVSWLIGIRFLNESFSNKSVSWAIRVLALLGLLLYYISFPDYENSTSITYTRWFILLISGHILIFFAPFTSRWNKLDYWNYLQRIIIAISRSVVFSGIIYLGLSLALLAIENLFSINIRDEIYGDLFVICLGIINTFIYLSDFPTAIHHTQQLYYSKALDVLIKYILIPIVLLYLVIVYAYSLKILITWELPQGWVSYLITILSVAGFIIHIIIEPIREKHPDLIVNKFYPFFYFSLFPLFILLFVAIFTRVLEYNFTENRYFLLIIALWILGISIYILISKKKRLSIIVISFFILCILSISGPWNAFKISTNAQSKELLSLIEKTKKSNLSRQEVDRFLNISRYLKERNELYLIDDDLGFKTNYITSAYNSGSLILDSIYGEKNYSKSINSNTNYFYLQNINKRREIDISDYEKFVEISLNKNPKSGYLLQVEDQYIIFKGSDKQLFKFNLKKDIRKKIKLYDYLSSAPVESFEYTITNEFGEFKLIINAINGNIENNDVKFNNIDGYILMRLH